MNNNNEVGNNGQQDLNVWNDGSLDESEGNDFLNFNEDNNFTVNYKMLEDNPVVSENKFGKAQWTFEVMEIDSKKVMSHSITSKRYMNNLKDYIPLSGKTFCVHRIGTGMSTDYQVVLVA